MADEYIHARRAGEHALGGQLRCERNTNGKCRHLIKGRMSSTGERMPGLEKQRWIECVAQDGTALACAAAEIQGDREIVLAAVAQIYTALAYAAAELKGDREIVLAAVAQKGTALYYAAAELQLSRALQWISTTNLALHCAKSRLAMATCTLPTSLCRGASTLSALPRDLTELIGTCITVDLLICVVARKYGYWFDGASLAHAREDSRRKKRKRS